MRRNIFHHQGATKAVWFPVIVHVLSDVIFTVEETKKKRELG